MQLPPGNRGWQPIARQPGTTGWHPQAAGRPPWLTEEVLERHAPCDWRTRYRTNDPWKAFQVAGRNPMAVVSIDVRKSTAMRRALNDPLLFEAVMENFFQGVRLGLQDVGLWFDKFMGDGILAYGPVWGTSRYGAVPLRDFLRFLGEQSALFDAAPLEALRNLVGPSLPKEAGLAIGVDAGVLRLWPTVGDVDLHGEPMIVASRMQSIATAGEIVVAPHLGTTIERDVDRALPKGMVVQRELRFPKDPVGGVSVYVMRYLPRPSFNEAGQVVGWTDPANPG